MGKAVVRLLECSRESLRVRTGEYRIEYDPTRSCLVVYREGRRMEDGHLSLTPGGGDPGLPVLVPDRISAIDCREDSEQLEVTAKGDLGWAAYALTLTFPRDTAGLLVSNLSIRVLNDVGARDGLFAGDHRELACHTGNDYHSPHLVYYLNGTPDSYTYNTLDGRGAMADRNQFVFYGDPEILDSTVFSFVDFTALRGYYEASHTRILDTVRQPPGCLGTPANTYMAQPFRFGYDVPSPAEAIHGGSEFVLCRTILCIAPGVPAIDEPARYCRRFIESVACAYPYVTRAAPRFVDWPSIVETGIKDLFEYGKTPGARSPVLQQCNLNSCARYAREFASEGAERLVAGAPQLYGTFDAKLPYGDAWQYLFPLVMAGEYALEFDSQEARGRFLEAAEDVIELGRALDYTFPRRIRNDYSREPEVRYEYDCTGAYVYLMLLYHDVTREQRYVEEAELAAERLLATGFEFPYEFTTASLAPLALLRLYRLTGDQRYLEGSYIPVAATVRHSWFFDPGYREYAGRSIFLLTEAMPGVYANGWEEQSLIRYLSLYLRAGFDDMAPEVALIIGEMLRYKCSSLADSLAPLLPDRSIVYGGVPREWHIPVRTDWNIPMEGFGYLEWDESGLHDRPGRVSQPPYCFGAIPEAALVQFHRLGSVAMLYIERPARVTRDLNGALVVRTLVHEEGTEARIIAGLDQQFTVSTLGPGAATGEIAPPPVYDPDARAHRFRIEAGIPVRISTQQGSIAE